MGIKRPYYGLHQIDTGLYTSGDEYVLYDGSDYIGTYHRLPNSQLYTYAIPKNNSEELYIKRSDIIESVKRYNRLTEQSLSKYVSPITYQPILTPDDYEIGEIQRFFVQKRNNPLLTIVEIDSDQFNAINTVNAPGINGVIWNHVIVNWKISKFDMITVENLNTRQLIIIGQKFYGIGLFISNILEFYK